MNVVAINAEQVNENLQELFFGSDKDGKVDMFDRSVFYYKRNKQNIFRSVAVKDGFDGCALTDYDIEKVTISDLMKIFVEKAKINQVEESVNEVRVQLERCDKVSDMIVCGELSSRIFCGLDRMYVKEISDSYPEINFICAFKNCFATNKYKECSFFKTVETFQKFNIVSALCKSKKYYIMPFCDENLPLSNYLFPLCIQASCTEKSFLDKFKFLFSQDYNFTNKAKFFSHYSFDFNKLNEQKNDDVNYSFPSSNHSSVFYDLNRFCKDKVCYADHTNKNLCDIANISSQILACSNTKELLIDFELGNVKNYSYNNLLQTYQGKAAFTFDNFISAFMDWNFYNCTNFHSNIPVYNAKDRNEYMDSYFTGPDMIELNRSVLKDYQRVKTFIIKKSMFNDSDLISVLNEREEKLNRNTTNTVF